MGRAPCCEKIGLKRGRWTAEEDEILTKYIQANGEGHWRSLPKNAGLLRCGKSCRLRWVNYLKADVKRGNISTDEESIIINLHATVGNRWSLIASYLPGRTDNEIKNYWNTHLCRKIDTFRRPANNSVPIPIIMDLNKRKSNPPTKKKVVKTGRSGKKKSKTRSLAKAKEASSQDNVTGGGIIINNNEDNSMLLDSCVGRNKENKNQESMPTPSQDHVLSGITLEDGPINSENNNTLGFERGNKSEGRCDGINDDGIDILSFSDIIDGGLLDEDWPPTSHAYIDNNNAIASENKIEDVICKDIASPKGESGEWNYWSPTGSKCLDDVWLNWDWERKHVAQGNDHFEVDDDNGYPFRCLWESEATTCEENNCGEATYGEKQHALVSWLLS